MSNGSRTGSDTSKFPTLEYLESPERALEEATAALLIGGIIAAILAVVI